jgi:hypothetical protein
MRLVSHVELIPSRTSRTPPGTSTVAGRASLLSQREPVEYQSSFERDFVIMCDFASEVELIRWQPFTFEFDDHVTRTRRRYTPHYLVETITRQGARYTYVVEVMRKVEYDRIYLRDPEGPIARSYTAATMWCRQQPATEMVVITDQWLASRGLANVRLIRSSANYMIPDGLREFLFNEITIPGITFRSLIEVASCVGIPRPVAVSSALRLCHEDICRFDIAEPLGKETMFYEGARQRIFRF